MRTSNVIHNMNSSLRCSWILICASTAWVCPIVVSAASPRPNILVIVADDQGWNDIGYHNPDMRTPHLDRLARSGVELDCHYVQPQCTPVAWH